MTRDRRQAVGEGTLDHDFRTADIETSSEDYARRFRGSVGEWFLRVQARTVSDLLGDAGRESLSVLDVGGGHGQLTRPLLDAGHRVVVHGSRPVCHDRLSGLGTSIARITSDLWHLPFSDDAFDLVVGIRLLAHVDEWRLLLGEMTRVSRRFVLVDFPARGPHHALVTALFGAKRKLEGNTRPYFDYLPSEIEEVFESRGMRISGATRQFGWPMALHRGLRSARFSALLESVSRALGITDRFGSPVLMLAEAASGSGNSEVVSRETGERGNPD